MANVDNTIETINQIIIVSEKNLCALKLNVDRSFRQSGFTGTFLPKVLAYYEYFSNKYTVKCVYTQSSEQLGYNGKVSY